MSNKVKWEKFHGAAKREEKRVQKARGHAQQEKERDREGEEERV